MKSDLQLKMALLIVVGSIPTAVLGLLFSRVANRLFASVMIVGVMLIVTGLLLWVTRGKSKDDLPSGVDGLTAKNAIVIGIVQGLAIIPGMSRSGATISTGLMMGIDREIAARYSFLLSIPAIVGAGMLSLKESISAAGSTIQIPLVGAITAAIVGYAALRVLLKVVKKGRLHMFAPYCWLVGLLALIFGL